MRDFLHNMKPREKESRTEQLSGLVQPFSWPSLSELRSYRANNGIPRRIHRTKALGNAQVPLQAAAAFSILWQMMEAANA